MSRREDLIAVANTYLQEGLMDHDPDAVLFAEDCVRIEMGYETGGNAAQLRELLLHDALKANKAMRDLVWVVEEPFVDVWYRLELHDVEEPLRISTRFQIVEGLIQRIEILFDAGVLQPGIIESLQELRTDL
ncbi:MAG: hypothetical protein JRJ58_21980 [Deltaproteobacteria bacterium]|nr:hypothetical protein [Deltaproteobacteria bacterium]